MVGAVGEMASMKRCKLWKTGEDGLCCSSSAIQTRLGPSSLLEGRSETLIVCVVVYPPNGGKRPRYIGRIGSLPSSSCHLHLWLCVFALSIQLDPEVLSLGAIKVVEVLLSLPQRVPNILQKLISDFLLSICPVKMVGFHRVHSKILQLGFLLVLKRCLFTLS